MIFTKYNWSKVVWNNFEKIMSRESIKNKAKCPTKHFLSVTLKCDEKYINRDVILGRVDLKSVFKQNINYTNIDLETED